MKIKSVLKPKQVAWISGVLLAAILGVAVSRSAAKPSPQTPSLPVVEVALVEQKMFGSMGVMDRNPHRTGKCQCERANHGLPAHAQL